jgi:Xaa-Pro aminopeptidase
MPRFWFLFCLFMTGSFFLSAQGEEVPQDYLNADFHQARRETLRQLMPPNSAAILFANPIQNRANDVDYVYHQDPDFYYLTGYRETNAVLILFSTPQQDEAGESYDELIFVQARNSFAEMWTGRRLGTEGVSEQLGFSHALPNTAFAEWGKDLSQLDQVFLFPFREDLTRGEGGSLYALQEDAKAKVQFTEMIEPARHRLYELIRSTEVENHANVAQVIDRYLSRQTPSPDDPLLQYQQAETNSQREEIAAALPSSNLNFGALGSMMGQLREVKQPEELQLLRKAIDISAVGQVEVMKAMHPEMSERQVQGIHEFVYKMYDAEYEGYPSIVGAGENGCILHYIDNQRPRLKNDLVLMDLGAEYRGYTADVTRTIPANGTFSEAQKAIYELVYEAQEAAFAVCKPGNPFGAPHAAAKQVIDEGLAALGIIQPGSFHGYFPHGTSHYIGLDVHDRGSYGPLEENMVITVEPGIYIPMNAKCEEKWWGIAVRIEDDILITAEGYELLSDKAPRTVEEIEATMKQASALDNLILPKLD